MLVFVSLISLCILQQYILTLTHPFKLYFAEVDWD